jgi:Fe-S cluster biogenesis protein NfuA
MENTATGEKLPFGIELMGDPAVSNPSAIERAPAGGALPEVDTGELTEDECDARSLRERVMHLVDTVISPILKNDGGRLDVLGTDEASGELSVRFVGSCANCPYSLLSMEQLVKPSLLAIPGVTKVTHRGRMLESELTRAKLQPGNCKTGPASAVEFVPLNSSQGLRIV